MILTGLLTGGLGLFTGRGVFTGLFTVKFTSFTGSLSTQKLIFTGQEARYRLASQDLCFFLYRLFFQANIIFIDNYTEINDK